MGKVCVACGVEPEETKKTEEEAEDCVNCDGKETVRVKEGETKDEGEE